MKKLMYALEVIGAVFGGLFFIENVSATSYQNNINVQFGLESSLTFTLSGNTLAISNLASGSAGNSNEITLNISSNNPSGCRVEATAGSSTYNTSNLVHNSVASEVFNSIAVGTSVNSLATDGTWGYSTDSGATYSGLPLYTAANGATVGNSNTSGSFTAKFLIGAKASPAQASGDYRNVVNFAIVANISTTTDFAAAFAAQNKAMLNGFYKMQDMSNYWICRPVDIGSEIQLIDERDFKIYWVAKLADGNCWMTQNLDYDIKEDITYDCTDTDIQYRISSDAIYPCDEEYYDYEGDWVGIGYPHDGWKPIRSTIGAADYAFSGMSVDGWESDYDTPYSVDLGNRYVYTSGTSASDTRYDSLADCEEAHPGVACSHYHIGNLYNWAAAVGVNDAKNSMIGSSDEPMPNSVCPRGWRLPIGRYSGDNEDVKYDVGTNYSMFSKLLQSQGITTSQYTASGAATYTSDGFVKMREAPLYFVRAGHVDYNGVVSSTGFGGYYYENNRPLSNTSGASYQMRFSSTEVRPDGYLDRRLGFSVRCVVAK